MFSTIISTGALSSVLLLTMIFPVILPFAIIAIIAHIRSLPNLIAVLVPVFVVSDWLTLLAVNAGFVVMDALNTFTLLCAIVLMYFLKHPRKILDIKLLISFIAAIAFLLFSVRNHFDAYGLSLVIRNFLLFPFLLFLILSESRYDGNPKGIYLLYHLLLLLMISSIMIIYQYGIGKFDYFIDFGIYKFYENRGFEINDGQLPMGFVTTSFSGNTTIRPLGVFLSPDKLAYLVNAAVYILVYICLVKRYNLWLCLLISVAAALQYYISVKAAMFQLMVFLLFLFSYRLLPQLSLFRRILTFAGSIAIGVFIVLEFSPRAWLHGSGAIQHIWGLTFPFQNIVETPLRLFLGQGFIGTEDKMSKWDDGAESFVGTLLSTGGLVLYSVWTYVYYILDRKFLQPKLSKTPFWTENGIKIVAVSSLLWAVYGAAFFSIASLSWFQSVSVIGAILAIVLMPPLSQPTLARYHPRSRPAST